MDAFRSVFMLFPKHWQPAFRSKSLYFKSKMQIVMWYKLILIRMIAFLCGPTRVHAVSKIYFYFILILRTKKKQNNKTSTGRPGKGKSPKTVIKKDVPSQT